VKRLAAALELARARRSRIAKEEAIGGALREVGVGGDEAVLAIATRIASGRVLPVGDGRALGVGWSLMLDVVRSATGWEDEIIAACARKTGVMTPFPRGVKATMRILRSSELSARLTSPLATSRSTATLIDPGVRLTFGPITLTGSGPL